MRVGLTFNMKRGEAEEAQEPPSSIRTDDQAEWDAPETIAAVQAALEERHEVIPIDAGEDAYATLQKARPDIVFNMAEGASGPCREGYIPSILEHLKIPYTASDPLTLNICLDKSRTKEILAYYGLPTSRFRVVSDNNFSFNSLHYPLMVKPLYEGSSIGIRNDSLVRTRQEMKERVLWLLNNYNEPALVEEFLPGREFTVAILGNGSEARVLPMVEILFDSLPQGVNPIYSYEAKWIWDQSSNPLKIFECPAKLSRGTAGGDRKLLPARLQHPAVPRLVPHRCAAGCCGTSAYHGAQSAAGNPASSRRQFLFPEIGSRGGHELQPADQ